MSYYKRLRNTSGFTLIELLVVIAIIGILSSVVLASLNGARESSRDARRQTDLTQIRTGLALYRDSNGGYPADLYTDLAGSDAMTQVPTDPDDGSNYAYTATTSAGDFCLGATLESSSTLPDDNSSQCVTDLNNGSYSGINYAISG